MATRSGFAGMRALALVTLMIGVTACSSNPDKQFAGTGTTATPGSAQDFVVNVGDRVFFETDSTQLTQVAQGTLDRQAQWLQQYPQYKITLEGHADERGTREYNIALGARRSSVSKDYLQSKGISNTRINTLSYGKERPVAVCADISCWSQNRRSVTLLRN